MSLVDPLAQRLPLPRQQAERVRVPLARGARAGQPVPPHMRLQLPNCTRRKRSLCNTPAPGCAEQTRGGTILPWLMARSSPPNSKRAVSAVNTDALRRPVDKEAGHRQAQWGRWLCGRRIPKRWHHPQVVADVAHEPLPVTCARANVAGP